MRTSKTAPRRSASRFCWLASTALTFVLLPFYSLPVVAQQTAAPELETTKLPEVRVTAPPPSGRSSGRPRPSPAATSTGTGETTVVVSPTGTPTPAENVASSVTVITAQDIEREQRRTVPDALSNVPGLNIVQTGGPGGVTSVFLRGANPNQTKVFIDGIAVSDPSNPNGEFDFGQLLTNDIERIEVLRGPQSGLYGADAIGGVISIITKKGEGPPKVTTTVEGGSFGTFNQFGSLSGSQDRFNYSFNVGHWLSTSTPVTPLDILPPGQRRINDFYDNQTYSTKLGYDFNEYVTINYVARYTDAMLKFTGDNPFTSIPNPTQSHQFVQQFYSRGETVVSLFDGRFKNYFGINYTHTSNLNTSPNFAPTENGGQRVRYDWGGVITAIPGQTFLLGLQNEKDTLNTNFPTPLSASSTTNSAYAEAQLAYNKMAFFVANVRYDNNDTFGAHTTYRLAPAVIVPETETKLKASYGTGFKAPTLNQRFVSFPDFNFFANPNLKPEEAAGWDAGFEQPLFKDRVRFGATYFHNDITNLIQFTSTGTSSTLINVGQATTSGWELFAGAVVTDRIKVRADYTFTRAIDDITGLELLRRPRHKASFTTLWNPIDPLTLSATVLHVGDWKDIARSGFPSNLPTKGYTVVNLAGNYKVNGNVTAFARIDNLFNEHYQNPLGFERPGFGIFGGIRVEGQVPSAWIPTLPN